MRIAVISTMGGFPWGGSEELWAAMVDEALKEGHEVALSIYCWPSLPHRIVEMRGKGVQVFQRPFPGHGRRNRIAAKIRPPFRDLFNFKPDVVCISQGGSYDAVSLRGPFSLVSPLYSVSVPYVVICQLNRDTDILGDADRGAAREFFARAYRVAFVAHHNMKSVERQLAQALPNAIVLRNPVNLTDLRPISWPQSASVRIASVARLEVAFKAQDILFEALSSEVWRSRDWRLSLCGDGPDQGYLAALARFYGLSERVDFMEHVKDVRSIWSEHQLLALPSRAEGTPLVLVEAMLCGRPAVVTNVGGNAEWVEEGQTGFVAEAPTARSFGATLERAWLDQERWQQMGTQARQYALAKIDRSPGKSLLKILLDAACSPS